MSDYSKIALEYYTQVDAKNYAWVVNMFAPDGVYDRAGGLIKGHTELRKFYQGVRKIKITHGDLKVWDCGRDIFVEGSFSGEGADGTARAGQFADHWTFNDAGKVKLRRTSLFTGAGSIRD
ncbi:MAG: nuclear transport factor 2 family protein [Alphaproteobacteria bacterium]